MSRCFCPPCPAPGLPAPTPFLPVPSAGAGRPVCHRAALRPSRASVSPAAKAARRQVIGKAPRTLPWGPKPRRGGVCRKFLMSTWYCTSGETPSSPRSRRRGVRTSWRGLTHPGHRRPRPSRDGARWPGVGRGVPESRPARPPAGGLGVLWAGRAVLSAPGDSALTPGPLAGQALALAFQGAHSAPRPGPASMQATRAREGRVASDGRLTSVRRGLQGPRPWRRGHGAGRVPLSPSAACPLAFRACGCNHGRGERRRHLSREQINGSPGPLSSDLLSPRQRRPGCD